MLSTADFRSGLTIEIDGVPFQIVEFQHVKPGKGPAFVRSRLKNLKTGRTLEKTWNAGEKVAPALIQRSAVQYLYRSGDRYTFMDLENFDQIEIGEDMLGDGASYLLDGLECLVTRHDGVVIGLDIPAHLDLTVVQTDPGIRGDTATGGSKPATLETGAVVQVPLFVNTGERIRVDTRTNTYVERVTT